MYSGENFEQVYGWYKAWKAYQIMPFKGGYADQPKWIWYDFNKFELLEMGLRIPESTGEGMTRTEDLRGK